MTSRSPFRCPVPAGTLLVLLLSLLAARSEPAPGPGPGPAPKPVPGALEPVPAPSAPAPSAPAPSAPAPSADLERALKGLKLPGVKIDPEKWCVDVEAAVCLDAGTLEFIACTKDTKEHESIVVVAAKPSHIHTALLLLGAVPGNPAMRQAVDAEGMRFIDLPPRGDPIGVFLVVKDPDGKDIERPISDFIAPAERLDGGEGEGVKFPTHTFVFAGSILFGEGDGPRTYLADQSGSVISLSTFGDELLCLPGIYGHENGALLWQIDGDALPAADTKVTLRLRPQGKPRPAPKEEPHVTSPGSPASDKECPPPASR